MNTPLNNIPALEKWVQKEFQFLIDTDFQSFSALPSRDLRFCAKRFSLYPKIYDLEFFMHMTHGNKRKELSGIMISSLRGGEEMFHDRPVKEIKEEMQYFLTRPECENKKDDILKILDGYEGIDTPKAVQTRKAINAFLKQNFGLKLKSMGGGSWIVHIPVSNFEVTLEFDFGGFWLMTYNIYLPLYDKRGQRVRISYEELLLSNYLTDFNLLRTDILDEQISLIFENIQKIFDALTEVEDDILSFDLIGDNPSKTIERYQHDAENGDINSQFVMGCLNVIATGTYFDERYRQRDLEKARFWFEKSAEAGHAGSQTYLSQKFSNGTSGKKDLIQAYKWCVLSRDTDEEYGQLKPEEITQNMTAEDIEKAKNFIQEYKSRNNKKSD